MMPQTVFQITSERRNCRAKCKQRQEISTCPRFMPARLDLPQEDAIQK
jgi:hypothetical protein